MVEGDGWFVGIIINCDMCFVLFFEKLIIFVCDVMMKVLLIIVVEGIDLDDVVVIFV